MLDAPSQHVSPRPNPPIPQPAAYSGKPARLLAAARTLLTTLQNGCLLSAAVLREAMTGAFGGTDADGAWVWKDAYDAAEAAVVLFIKRYGTAMRREAGAGPQGPSAMLAMLERLAALEPSHTRRSEEQVRLQQFSTPLPLAYAALQAATIRPGDRVLEPSAGTGILAVMAHCSLGAAASQRLYVILAASIPAHRRGSTSPNALAMRAPLGILAPCRTTPIPIPLSPPSPNWPRRRSAWSRRTRWMRGA